MLKSRIFVLISLCCTVLYIIFFFSQENEGSMEQIYFTRKSDNMTHFFDDDNYMINQRLQGLKTYQFEELFDKIGLEEEMKRSIKGNPFDHLVNYKNPCWIASVSTDEEYDAYGDNPRQDQARKFKRHMAKVYKERLNQDGFLWRMRCLPYLYILGFSKCGTTDLNKKMNEHPHIYETKKEMKFWDTYLRTYNITNPQYLPYYLDFYDYPGELMRQNSILKDGGIYHPGIAVDGTVSTIWQYQSWDQHPKNQGQREPQVLAAHLIKELTPQAKFIIIMRNPVDRFYSHYHMIYPEGSATEFHEAAEQGVQWWQQCVLEHGQRACAYDVSTYKSNNNLTAGTFIRVSLYSIYIRDWLEIFPRENFLMLRTEDYNQDTFGSLAKIYQFIGLEPLDSATMTQITKLPQSNTAENKSVNAQPMLDKTKLLLDKFFNQYNQDLTTVLQDTDYLWMDNI